MTELGLITSLPVSIQSPDQLRACADDLTIFMKTLVQVSRRQAAGGQKVQLANLTKPSLELLRLLTEKQRSDPSAIEQLIADVEKLLSATPVVHITMAGLPSASLRAELTRWFRSAIQPSVLIAFHASPDLAGGIVVRTLNRVYDFSFRTKLLAKHDKFVEVLERV